MAHLLHQQRQRLSRTPADLSELHAQIDTQVKENGSNPSGYVLHKRDVAALRAETMFRGTPSAFDVLLDFHNSLTKRGVQLIVLPVPQHVMLYGHRLLSEVGPDAELWPQYTAGLIRLLEEGVEVIDLRDRFVDSGEPGAMQHWDHHWAPLGMEMAAELLGDRLRCEGWLDPEPEGRRFEEIHVLVQTPGSLRREHQAAFLSMPDNMVVKRVVDRSAQAPPTGIDPILLLGDSQLNTLASYPSGSGFPNYMSRELGFLVPFTGQGAGGS